jgi:hypothetical protein
MVRSVESIRQEIKSLEKTTATLAAEFDRLYSGYLDMLGQAIRRQVVIATYHLCTQVYPDSFLALSVSQRQHLQKNIRHLGRDGQAWLQQLMDAQEPEIQEFDELPADQQARITRLTAALEALPREEDEDEDEAATVDETAPDGEEPALPRGDIQAAGGDLPGTAHGEPPAATAEPGPGGTSPASDSGPEPGPDLDSDPEPEGSQALPKRAMDPRSLIQSVIMAAMADDMQETLRGRPFTGDTLTPTLLAKHHLILEQRIRRVLHRVSKQANHALKQAEVIPDLPEAVLDAAAEAETGPEKGRSMPNLLNVLVEMSSDMENGSAADDEDGADGSGDMVGAMDDDMTDDMDDDMAGAMDDDMTDDMDDDIDDEDGIRGMMTHLAAVNLRLSDLEFADVQSSLWRSKLRTALGRLRKLGKQYQRSQRELAIAEAEQAWRAVWYDESSD